MSLPKYTASTPTYDFSIPKERVIKQNCNIPVGYKRLSCYFANTAENGVYFKVGQEGAKTIALGGPLTEDTIVGNTETDFSIAIGTGDDKKGGAGFMAIEKLDANGKLPQGFPLRDFFTITDYPAIPGTQKIINDEGVVLYVSKFENNPTKGQFVMKTGGIDSEGTLNFINPGQPAIYSTDITSSYESDAYTFISANQYGDPSAYGTAGAANMNVIADSLESDSYVSVSSQTSKAAGDANAFTTISALGSGVDANAFVTLTARTSSNDHSLSVGVDNAGNKSLLYRHGNTAVYGLPTPNTFVGAGKMLITDATNVLQFSDIQAVLALVPAYVDNATAVGAGLAVGDTYYNITSTTYTRVL
tara:strand:+ start:21680 stop:22759 length:1080 start_codon:yes stop_codon:yes gene_type:complete